MIATVIPAKRASEGARASRDLTMLRIPGLAAKKARLTGGEGIESNPQAIESNPQH